MTTLFWQYFLYMMNSLPRVILWTALKSSIGRVVFSQTQHRWTSEKLYNETEANRRVTELFFNPTVRNDGKKLSTMSAQPGDSWGLRPQKNTKTPCTTNEKAQGCQMGLLVRQTNPHQRKTMWTNHKQNWSKGSGVFIHNMVNHFYSYQN